MTWLPLRPPHGLAAFGLLALAAAASAADHRPITETDLFQFVWIADPQISPDGKAVVFVRVTVNAKKDGYETALWRVASDGTAPPRPFTSGPHDSSPRWSPDGKRLVFARAVEKDGKPEPPQLDVIAADGGEAQVLTDQPQGAASPAWSPDGKTIVFTSEANAKDLEKKKKASAERDKGDKAGEKKEGSSEKDERESDVRVITRAVYRFNGAGYVDYDRPGHLWTIEVPADGKPAAPARQVTSGAFDEEGPAWSADGSRIYFVSDRVKEPYYYPPDSDLYSVPASGGERTRVASIDGEISEFAVNAAGRIAFRGRLNAKPPRSYDQPDLFVVDAPGAAPRNLTEAFDYDVGDGLTGDQHPPRAAAPSPPVWSADGRSIVMGVEKEGRVNLARFDVATGTVTPVTEGDREIVSFSASANASRLAFVSSTPTRIGDLYLLALPGGKPLPLTGINDGLFAQLQITPPEAFWYTSFDGRKIQAFLQKPPDFDPRQKYPLILNIHGGPHAAYGYTFFHEMQWMAARGYLVLYPNPRGSTSYGQEFGNVIQFHYPGDDYQDLMAGVDEIVRRGWADPARLGVTGGSGGGVLTNWTVTHTDRFAAAVSQRSIADWAGFWYTADFTLFGPTWFKGAPWEDPTDFATRSAITQVNKVTTPLMLVEGESDLRTPPGEGGEVMFRALKYLKKATVMVRFPGETHELSRSGQPWHRVERLRHIVGWFDRYLLGKNTDAYDVP